MQARDDTSILVAGATGLVGRACARRLLDDPAFGRIVVPTRRPLPRKMVQRAANSPVGTRPADAERLDERRIDFERLGSDEYRSLFEVDQILWCLGTTIKKAGSRERFRDVDQGYAATAARCGAEHGVRHFLLVSALGADPESRIFYNRVKGELEHAVTELPFRSVTIVRPSLLLGDRAEFRLGEELAQRLAFLFPRKYKPVDVEDVSAVLIDAAKRDLPGQRIIESAEIREHAAARG